MSVVRAPVPGLTAGACTLSRETSHYLCRVLRLRAGDRFVAFDPASSPRREAEAVLEVASAEAAVARLEAPREARVVAQAALALVYGLSKGDKVDDVVRDATELGATRVVVTPMARSVVKVEAAARGATKVERWKRIAEQAARQSGRADPPEVVLAGSLAEALELARQEASFCLAPTAETPLGPALSAARARCEGLAFVIGPEGGMTEAEIRQAAEAGYLPASLGPFVLRTETVAAAVLGAVRVLGS